MFKFKKSTFFPHKVTVLNHFPFMNILKKPGSASKQGVLVFMTLRYVPPCYVLEPNVNPKGKYRGLQASNAICKLLTQIMLYQNTEVSNRKFFKQFTTQLSETLKRIN